MTVHHFLVSWLASFLMDTATLDNNRTGKKIQFSGYSVSRAIRYPGLFGIKYRWHRDEVRAGMLVSAAHLICIAQVYVRYDRRRFIVADST